MPALLGLMFAALLSPSGCSLAKDNASAIHENEQLRLDHPALYELERTRSRDPAPFEADRPQR